MWQVDDSGKAGGMRLRRDIAGDGRYGASRGSRRHRGVDLECRPGLVLHAELYGKVTKHGYCYRDDPAWRYIEVTDVEGSRHRFFYVEPLVVVGEYVDPMTGLGIAQDITNRYPGQGMTAHVHFEVITSSGEYIDPTSFCAAGQMGPSW